MSTPSHDQILALAGTWKGAPAAGSYPTIDDFEYEDEWVFTVLNPKVIHYVERTRRNGKPAHTETGYLRFPGDGSAEIVAAIITGQSENGRGTVELLEDGSVEVRTVADVANTPSAKQVDRIARVFRYREDALTFHLDMEAVGQPMTRHLEVNLTRVG